MSTIEKREWVSTTEAAHLLGLSHMTIIRRFDANDIKGFRVPGSRFRRIPKTNLLDFARESGLPMPEMPGLIQAPEVQAPKKHGKIRMLIVEDDADARRLAENVFGHDGRFEVQTASDGFHAGFEVAHFKPEIVLLDIQLPGVSGLEICRTIRENPEIRDAKILVTSGVRDNEIIDALRAAGIEGFLRKPFTVDVLKERVESILDENLLAQSESTAEGHFTRSVRQESGSVT